MLLSGDRSEDRIDLQPDSQFDLILDGAQLMQFIHTMCGRDLADGSGQAAYNEAIGLCAIAKVADAMQQLAIRDTGGRKEYILG